MTALYGFVRATLRLGLRAFFREIEVHGLDNVPADGPLVILANHHNSMIDPSLIVATVGRPVSFIAKEPLFRVPVLGSILRALRCVPAHRSQDPGYAKEKNQGLYDAACALLADGGALGIFPEGKSHTDPHLAEFKHGASRIAFEAEAAKPGVRVQLVGIHFEETRTFRGRVLVRFGPPLTLDAYRTRYAEDPRAATAALTGDLHARLSEMILSAENRELLEMADLVERMAALDAGDSLKALVDRKKRLLSADARLRERAPEELARLKEALRRYRQTLDLLGVSDEQIARDYRFGRVLAAALVSTLLFGTTLPVLAMGLTCNFPPYLVAWTISRLFGRTYDRRATAAFSSALVLFPAYWAALAIGGFVLARAWGAAAVAAAAPVSGLIALRWMDAWSRVMRSAWGLWTAVTLPAARAKLRRMRTLIRARVQKLADMLQASP